MSTATTTSPIPRGPELLGQTVVVIGGSAGIGLETARRARAEGANANPHRQESRAPPARRERARRAEHRGLRRRRPGRSRSVLPGPAGADRPCDGHRPAGPYYARLADLDLEQAHRDFDEHLWLTIAVAQHAVGKVRPGGTLLFMGGTGGRRRGPGLSRRLRRAPPRCPP